MAVAALILAVVGIVAAFVAPAAIELVKRPRLKIIPAPWEPQGPTAWTFATVRIRNKPITARLVRGLMRQAAQGCVVDIDFFRWGTEDKPFRTVPGRWSSHPEPIRSVPTQDPFIPGPPPSGGTASTMNVEVQPGFSRLYDSTLDPRQQDVTVGPLREEVAVAILKAGEAFAFSTESYDHNAWGNPAWGLDHGTYRVVVRVRGSSVEQTRAFKLEYLDDNFANFRLQVV
jgi:hypothetical protein